jgi:GT2 family glycosyltransferase/glycosyltransferase involved in cell wall biosynthesis
MVRLARLADRVRAVPALFVSYAGLLGGAERLLLDAASAFNEPPTLACPEGPLAERAREDGLHVIALRERPLELRGGGARRRAAAAFHLAGLRREVKRLVEALDPEVVFAWGMRAGLASQGLGRRQVFQHNDLMPGPAIARAVRTAARRADVVVTPSECVAQELGLPGVQVIHPGVNLGRFDPTPPLVGAPEVLVLGAIEPWKRPELALEIAALCPDVRLRLAGAPISAAGEELLARLHDRAGQPDLDGRVEFAGPVEAAGALARAHCLLHCADREPYGMVLVEALAAGRPVVAPASGGPLEIVDGTCGRLYEPGGVEEAAHALVEALDNAEQLGAAGRQRAEQYFDVNTTRESYRNLLPTHDTRHPTPNLALVTVTHNSAHHLPRLLASAKRHVPGARVVVVDSGSSDSSAALAREAGATVIELDENVGFGRATNAGVATVNEPVTVLVNPDVELVDDSLLAFAAELSQADRILAPLVLRPDGSRQDSAQAPPGSAAALAIALIPPAAMPAPVRRATCPWTANRPRPVAWAVGCCLAARTDTLKRLGPFDERIFMYGEDMELGLRAGDQGIETWFRPEARVIHRSAHSTDPAFGGEAFELLAEQRRKVVAQRRGQRVARRDDLLQGLTFVDRIVVKTLTGRSSDRERKQLKALLRWPRQ